VRGDPKNEVAQRSRGFEVGFQGFLRAWIPEKSREIQAGERGTAPAVKDAEHVVFIVGAR
jgi:hypothetical protein